MFEDILVKKVRYDSLLVQNEDVLITTNTLEEMDENTIKVKEMNNANVKEEDVVRKTVDNNQTKNIKCDQCNFHTHIPSSLNSHKKSVHEAKIYPCDTCQIQFRNKDTLKVHVETKHHTTYNCHRCDKKYRFPRTLKTHITKVHEPKSAFKCDYCDSFSFSVFTTFLFIIFL